MVSVNKNRKGFTLTEIMISVLILALLGAIGFGVAGAAKARSKETASVNFLKQTHLFLSLYRSDHDGDGRYGTADEMGLPPTVAAGKLLKQAGLVAPRLKPDPQFWAGYFPRDRNFCLATGNSQSCRTIVARCREFYQEHKDSGLVYGYYYGENGCPFYDDRCVKRGTAIALDGSLTNNIRTGILAEPFNWSLE